MRERWFLGVVAAGLMAVCGWPVAAADAEKPARLLVVSVTTGIRHASIGTAEPVLEELGRSTGLFHCDFLRMPPGRLPQPKAPKRGNGESDDDWKRREAEFQEEQKKFRRNDEAADHGRGRFLLSARSDISAFLACALRCHRAGHLRRLSQLEQELMLVLVLYLKLNPFE